jgi:translation initiation factor 2B subunit (eIF-2B alpha/beta/delta family)
MNLFIKKVISGGQTGADRAGLEAAKKAGIETGGYCPKGYLTEKGSDKSLKKFGLIQTESQDYTERTELNIRCSDGTVVFSRTDESGNVTGIGTLLTLKIAKDSGKPVIINPESEEFTAWILNNDIRTLNVAGNRKSQNKDIEKTALRFLAKNLLIPDKDALPKPKEYTKFEKETTDLKNDRISGSVTMTSRLNNAILGYVKESDEDIETINNILRRNLYDFKTGEAANMVLLKEFINSVFEIINKENIDTDGRETYLTFLEEFKIKSEDINKRIVKNTLKGIDFKDKTVVLFSNSATVVSVFQELAKEKTFPEIIQCESEPGKEGLVQAETLKGLGFKVRVIEDDDIGKYVKKADILLLGCDGYNDEMFVNKIGTFALVFKFTRNEKPVYVLSDSRKYTKESFKFTKIKDNSLFEQIPLKRVTKMITEKS